MRLRLRFTCLAILGVYPLNTSLSYLVAPLTADWAIWQRTALLTPLIVAVMVYVLIPLIQARLASFAAPD